MNTGVYRQAMKAADDIISWAIKTYPQLDALGLPKVLGSYVTASIIFKESGYNYWEAAGERALVPRHIFRERYPMVAFIRSQWLYSVWKGPLTYYAVHESFVEFMGNASYYLPTVDEVKILVNSIARVPHITPLLVVPKDKADIQKILEVHLRGGSPKQNG